MCDLKQFSTGFAGIYYCLERIRFSAIWVCAGKMGMGGEVTNHKNNFGTGWWSDKKKIKGRIIQTGTIIAW
jgi:hypothetical protein